MGLQERSFRPGDRALLIDSRGRRYLITLAAGQRFHSHLGSVAHDDLVGAPEGCEVAASGGATLVAVRPTLADYVTKMGRGAQIVYPKDVGPILVYADIFPGATVIEAGTGSGALTLALARAVGESGAVVSYESRADHYDRAVRNVEAWYEGLGGKPDNIDLRNADVFAGVPETNVDRMVLDLPEPWRALEAASQCLIAGGILCCYLPTIPQVSETVEALRRGPFGLITAFESLIRNWNVEGRSVRPEHRMVAHTGFLLTARKLVNV